MKRRNAKRSAARRARDGSAVLVAAEAALERARAAETAARKARQDAMAQVKKLKAAAKAAAED